VGKMTLAWPLNPSVPPSISGFKLSGLSESTRLTNVALIHRLASTESSPQITRLNCM
jgi:hypothetical protein